MLEKVKRLLGVDPGDEERDELFTDLIDTASRRLKGRIGEDVPEDIPDELEYIVVEVVIKRFNRIGSEGVSSHSVEGESLSFVESDFDEFEDEITEWKKKNQKVVKNNSGWRFI